MAIAAAATGREGGRMQEQSNVGDLVQRIAQTAGVVVVAVAEDNRVGTIQSDTQCLRIVRQRQPLAGVEKHASFGGLNPETKTVFPKQAHALGCILSQDGDRDIRAVHDVFS
jgi:hypothetical protein